MTTELIQWEYKIDFNLFYTVAELNRLGSQGWELVSVTYSYRTDELKMNYYFKRPKQNQQP